jgi:hypothetical protein
VVGAVDWPTLAVGASLEERTSYNKRFSMASKNDRLSDMGKEFVHQFRNCVHQINMELDLAERERVVSALSLPSEALP